MPAEQVKFFSILIKLSLKFLVTSTKFPPKNLLDMEGLVDLFYIFKNFLTFDGLL